MKPSMREISRVTAAWFKITVEDLRSENRSQQVAWPRQIAMTLCRDMSGRSTVDVGKFFNRDHTTVLYASEAVAVVMATDDEEFRAMMAIAAEATGLSIDRRKQEREWAQYLHCGQPLMTAAPPEPIPPPVRALPVVPPGPSRRVMVPGARNLWPSRARPALMPSDLAPPSRARMMGARA
jgi:hypothetical protein